MTTFERPVITCPTCGSDETIPTFVGYGYQCVSLKCSNPEFEVEPPMARTEPLVSTVLDTAGAQIATIVTESALPGERTDNTYNLPEGISFDRWAGVMDHLWSIQTGCNFWCADAMIYGLDHFDTRAYQAVRDQSQMALGRSDEWVDQIVWIGREFPPDKRLPGLRWSHYRAVMVKELPPADRLELLTLAAAEHMPTRDLYKQARARANTLQGDVIDNPAPTAPRDESGAQTPTDALGVPSASSCDDCGARISLCDHTLVRLFDPERSYYLGRIEALHEVVDHVVAWAIDRGFIEPDYADEDYQVDALWTAAIDAVRKFCGA